MPLNGDRPPSHLPTATQPSRREVEWPCGCTAQLCSGKPLVLVVKLPSPRNNPSDRVWFSSSLFYFVETNSILLFFRDVQSCVYNVFFFLNTTLFLDELSHSVIQGPGAVLVFSCQPRARRSRLHREAFLPGWAWWSRGQGQS